MAALRILWVSVCVPVGVIGTVVAVVRSPAAMAFLFVVFGIVGSMLTLCLVGSFWERGTGGKLRLLAVGGLVAGTSVGAFIGYASLLGPGVLLLAAAVLAGSPYVVKACGRWLSSVRTPSAAQLDAVARALAYASPESVRFQPPPELRELTDEQLCKRWRASYKTSRRQSSVVRLMATVAERQMYLQELERRNAPGLAAWLAAGPGAWGDPLPYLTDDRAGPSTIDWDQLTRSQDR